jgi:histidine triad (HIT) family protein
MLYQDYLKGLRECPFCKIKNEEILKDNKNAILILSKAPYTKDHLLVVPKRHVLFLADLTKEEEKDIDALVYFAMKKMHKKYHDVSILYREGNKKKIGKSIDHIHYHIIPNLMIGAIDINFNKRKILTEADYLKLVKEIKKEF